MSNLGDFAVGSVVTLKFSTAGAGGPATLAGSPVIRCYKNGLLAECTTAPALSVDFDSVTGLHHVAVDTTLDAVFYAAGGDFVLMTTGGTVDGISFVQVLGGFSLQNRYVASGAPTAAEVAAAVWAYATRSLTTFGTLVADIVAGLSGVAVTVTSSIGAGGVLTIKQGDDYSASDSNALDFTYAGVYDPSSPTSITLKIYFGTQTLASWAGTVSGSVSPWTLRFEPTAAQTAAVNASANLRYDIEVVKSGRKRTIVEGACVVNAN